MPTLCRELCAAFRANDTEALRRLLARGATEIVGLMAVANRRRIQDLWKGLAAALEEARKLDLSPALQELRGFLEGLAYFAHAARQHSDDLERAREVRRRDFRPAILTAIRNDGTIHHEALAERLGLGRPALEQALRALADAKAIVATVEGDAVCYALTPLGHVVARGLEARAKAGEEVSELPPGTDRPSEEPANGWPPPATAEAGAAPAAGPVREEAPSLPGGPKERSKTRVAVLYGGTSSERELSLQVGGAVAEAVREARFLVEAIDVREAALSDLQPSRVDVAFVALRGTFGEDGGIQAVLDTYGVPYTGSGVEASRLATDKVAAKHCFRAAGVPTPAFLEVEAEWALPLKQRAAGLLGFPVVLKPTREGSSFGVVLVGSEAELEEALHRPFQFDTRALIEPFVEGRELVVPVLDDQPMPIVELLYDGAVLTHELKATPGAVGRVVRPELSPGVTEAAQATALAAHRALGCRGLTCADIRLSADGVPYVLEVNTIPPLTPDSVVAEAAAAAGIPFTALCERLVKLARASSLAPAPA